MRPQSRLRPRGVATPSAAGAPDKRGIPFDYAFRYDLTGRPGNVINSIVTISIEATFTAVAIGYGAVPKVQPIFFGPPTQAFGVLPPGAPLSNLPAFSLTNITVGQIVASLNTSLAATSRSLRGETGPEAVLRNGFKLNPDVAELVLQDINIGGNQLPPGVSERLFQVIGSPPELVQFKYAIFDEGSGREFQSEPILNTAGLGSANGERPFRYFAWPITFRPRSTIRMEITEVSDFTGELHVSLHGYKVLGDPGSPTGAAQRRAGRGRR